MAAPRTPEEQALADLEERLQRPVVSPVVAAAKKRVGEDCGPLGCARFTSRALKDAGLPFSSASSSDLRRQVLAAGGQEVPRPAPGDLFFHRGGPTGFSHVGIVGEGEIIDSPGRRTGYKAVARTGGPRVPSAFVRLPSRGSDVRGLMRDVFRTDPSSPEAQALADLKARSGSQAPRTPEDQAKADLQAMLGRTADPRLTALQRRSAPVAAPRGSAPVPTSRPKPSAGGWDAVLRPFQKLGGSIVEAVQIQGKADTRKRAAVGGVTPEYPYGAGGPRVMPQQRQAASPTPQGFPGAGAAPPALPPSPKADPPEVAQRRAFVKSGEAWNPFTGDVVRKRTGTEMTGAVAMGALAPILQKHMGDAENEYREGAAQGLYAAPPRIPAANKQEFLAKIARVKPQAEQVVEGARKTLFEAERASQAELDRKLFGMGRFYRDSPEGIAEADRLYEEKAAQDARAMQVYLARTKPETVRQALQAKGISLTPLQAQAIASYADASAVWTLKAKEMGRAAAADFVINLVADRFGARVATRFFGNTPGVKGALARWAAEGGGAGSVQQPVTRKIIDPKATPQDLALESLVGLGAGGLGGVALGGVGVGYGKVAAAPNVGSLVPTGGGGVKPPKPKSAAAALPPAPTTAPLPKKPKKSTPPPPETPELAAMVDWAEKTGTTSPNLIQRRFGGGHIQAAKVAEEVRKRLENKSPDFEPTEQLVTPSGARPLPRQSSEDLLDLHALLTDRPHLSGYGSVEAASQALGPDRYRAALEKLDDPEWQDAVEQALRGREEGQKAEAAGLHAEDQAELAGRGLAGKPLVEDALSQSRRMDAPGSGNFHGQRFKYYELSDNLTPAQREEIYNLVRTPKLEQQTFHIPGSGTHSLRDAIVDAGVVPAAAGKRFDPLLKTAKEPEPIIARNKDELAKALQRTAKLTVRQAKDEAEVFDAWAQIWAKSYGKSAEEFYEGVSYVRGGKSGSGALQQGTAPTFYSQLSRTIDAKMPNRAPVAQLRGLLNGAGVKPDEMKWTGLDDFLSEAEKVGRPVSKAEVQEFLRANAVEVREVTKGPTPEMQEFDTEMRRLYGENWRDRNDIPLRHQHRMQALEGKAQAPKYGQWVLPGGKNYRELLLTLPVEREPLKPFDQWLKENLGPEWTDNETTRSMYAAQQGPPKGAEYRSSHWDEPNVLAHVRFDERVDAAGKKVLHVAEIQSDWHQAGRKKGYLEPSRSEGWTAKESSGGYFRVYDQLGQFVGEHRGATAADAIRVAATNLGSGAVPAAPFSKTWHELALKRILRWAAENDFERVTWDTGATSADRYDLSKQVDLLEYRKDGDTYSLSGYTPDGNVHEFGTGISPEKLPDYVGKDVAERIIQGVGRTEGGTGRLSGVDLKVGGEGMKGFYDKILPAAAAKLGKKWGAKVTKGKVDAGLEKGAFDMFDPATGGTIKVPEERHLQDAWSLDITPEMRQSVLTEGQPLFQGPKASVEFDEAGRALIRFFSTADISSALHEHAHVFRRALAPDDLKTAEEWAGVSDGKWGVAHEEKFARAFERYMRDGKAPTEGLKAVFARIRGWLVGIYKRLKGGDLDVEVSKEMRDLFDRNLGGEGVLAREARKNALPPKPKPEYIGSLNADKLRLPDEAKAVVREAYDLAKDATDKFRRGTRSEAQTNEAADRLLKAEKITVDSLKKTHPGQAWNAESLRAIGKLHLRLLDDVQAAQKAYDGSGSVDDLAALVDAKTRYDVVALAHQGGATEAGRALQARKAYLSAYRGEIGKKAADEVFGDLPSDVSRQGKRGKTVESLFPRERAVESLRRLRARFNRPDAPDVLFQKPTTIPEDLKADLLDAGGYLLKDHADQKKWAAKMTDLLGPQVEPYLAPLWKALRGEVETRAGKAAGTKTTADKAKAQLTKMLGGNLGEDVLEKLRQAGDDPLKLAKVMQDARSPGVGGWLLGAYKSSLTSGPKTHLTNIVSTQLHMALRTPDKLFSGMWDPIVAKLSGKEREHFVREALPSMVGVKLGFQTGIRDFVDVMKHGMTPEQAARLDIHTELPGGMANPFVLNLRAQGATDAFNKGLLYHQALPAEALRQGMKEGLKGDALAKRAAELMEDAGVQERAWVQAEDYTFTGEPGKVAKKLLDLRDAVPLGIGHVVAPFARTPLNVARSAMEHSPLGFVNALMRLKQGGDVSEMLGKATTGTLLLVGAHSLLQGVEVTGPTPKEPGARDDFYRSGRKPYAFKVGDRWISYQGHGALTTILATVAATRQDYWDKGKQPPLEEWARAVMAAGVSLKDQSALTGLSGIAAAIEDEKGHALNRWIKQQAAGTIPFSSLLRTIQQTGDPHLREPETVEDAVKGIIPGLGHKLPPKLDVFGRPVKREPGGLGAAQRFVVGKESKDPVDRELHRLKIFPGFPEKVLKVGNTDVVLTREQQRALLKVRGEAMRKAAERVLNAPNYGKWTDEQRRTLLEKLMDSARKTATDKYRVSLRGATGVRPVAGAVAR